jgi:hypothetical protein
MQDSIKKPNKSFKFAHKKTWAGTRQKTPRPLIQTLDAKFKAQIKHE